MKAWPPSFQRDPVPRWGDRRALRVGLLGGSFNPAHTGHLDIARRACRMLGLDQVWFLVSPGNPLKSAQDMAPLGARMESVRRVAVREGPAFVVTGIEARLGTRYAVDTIRSLRRRFPLMKFVWLMGADVFAELPRWRRWRDFIRCVPLAVLPRPGANGRALHGRAASILRPFRLPAGQIRTLPAKTPPVWAFLPGRQNGISATELRRSGHASARADGLTSPGFTNPGFIGTGDRPAGERSSPENRQATRNRNAVPPPKPPA